MKRFLLLVALLNVQILFGQNKLPEKDQSAFTPSDLLSFNRIGDPQVSPDGQWVLYSMSTPSIKENSFSKDIFAIKIDGSEFIQVTKHQSSDFHARWIEDGKKIAFLSTRMGSPQIFTKEFPKGNTRGLTTIVGGVSTFRYSPDGQFIALTSDVKMEKTIRDKYPNLRKTNVLTYDDLPVRHWDHWEDEFKSHVFIMTSNGGDPIDIMEGENYDTPLMPFGGTEDYAWNPNSLEIAYTSKKVDNYEVSTNSDIFIYDIKSKTHSNISADNPGYDKSPIYSPDGMSIAYVRQNRAGFEADKIRLMKYDIGTKVTTDLTETLDQWVKQFSWAVDSKSMYFSASDNGREPLFKVDVASKEITKLTDGDYNYSSGMSMLPDGSGLIVGRTSMTQPVDFYKLNFADNNITRLTGVNTPIWSKIKDIKIEDRKVETTDGEQMQVWVLYPPDFDETKKYPMITYCQGGPQGTISNYFSYRWNLYLMASQGYVVCAPNRRGMPGFGQKWNDDISQDWGGQAMDDILSATDNVAAEAFVDETKVACVGASFGGYSAFWLEGHHDGRFACFISHCGVFNLESMYGSTEELFFPNWEFGGPYWESKNKDNYEDFSPHRFVDKWDTPMLIITGLKDFRVPYTQSLEAFTVLQTKGIDSKLLVFPGENHWVLSLQNAMVWQSEFFEWLDKHCKN